MFDCCSIETTMSDDKQETSTPLQSEKAIRPLSSGSGKRGAEDWRPNYFDILVDFYADPTEQRTFRMFCIENKLSEDTVFQYMRVHADLFWRHVDTSRAKHNSKLRHAAYRAVFANISKSFNDRKLALQLLGDFVERTQDMAPVRTPEEKRAAIAELLAKLSKTRE